MPCYKPLTAYHSSKLNAATGKRSLVFNVDQSLVPVKLQIACGQCIGCRLDRSLQWAMRCVHESNLHEENCFITLTFRDECCDQSGSLRVRDFQNFMKRLRKAISPRGVRFFHCGEYGSKLSRPHHHACLFGYDFPDKVCIREGANPLYASAMLAELWPYGFHTIGNVTFESAAYVARYVLKKWSRECASDEELYDAMKCLTVPDLRARYYSGRHPEYVTMSRRPGIGAGWYDKYKGDVYPSGFCVVEGRQVKPPKFYDAKFEIDDPLKYVTLKALRIEKARSNPHNSRARLDVREELKRRVCKQLTRGYENGSSSV